MKVEKTYRELLEFSAKIQAIQNAPTSSDPEQLQPRVLLLRAAKKFLKPLEDYEESMETLRIKNCLKDPITKKILKDEKGQYEFDADGTLNFLAEAKELQKTVVDVNYDTVLSYKDLLSTIPHNSQPYWQWEDVQDSFSPLYTPDTP